MSAWTSSTIVSNGITLHYTRTGGDKPPVVLAHGFSDDGLCWGRVARALEADYDLIMVDARGHGQSDAPEQGYTPDLHAADLAGLIVGLGLDRPAVLGHSMGAVTTMVLAATYPGHVGRALLEDPPPWWTTAAPVSAEVERQRWEGMRAWAAGLKRKTRDELIAGERASSPLWAEEEFIPWADAKHRMSLNVLSRTTLSADRSSSVSQIACPMLLITGDPDRGALVTSAAAAELQGLLPQLQVAHIPGAGHSIRRDQFEGYLAAVRAFLAESSYQSG